jgi:phage tail sheath protein FI
VTVELPGLTVEVAAPSAVLPPPLRTDVAGFLGATRRGPIGTPVRVESLNGYRDLFGDLDAAAATSYAVRGYYDNGGDLAWVTRVAGAGTPATAGWSVAGLAGFSAAAYQVVATSPGTWAEGGQVTISYRSASLTGSPEVDVRVVIPGETVEVFSRIPADQIAERLADSHLIRIVPVLGSNGAAAAPASPAPASPAPASPAPASPARRAKVSELLLSGGTDVPPDVNDYQAAVVALADQPEVAIVAAPDLGLHLPADDDRRAVMAALLSTAASRLDRLVLLDVPPGPSGHTLAPQDALAWAAAMLPGDPVQRRAAAVYYPGLMVLDPLGGLTAPLRALPPSGHVAGVISRLDRERGAYVTPANVVLEEAVDLDPPLTEPEQEAVFGAALNLLRCAPGRGLQVWGGRTLDVTPSHISYVAHRRLLHRLVRAIHQVADPLVFDVNGPELRLSLVRGVTSVLLAAFRAGALAGTRPQDGFQVVCDATNNPPGADPGQVVCDIAVAPAAPMEFIHLRLLVGQQSQAEVTES